MPLSKPLEIMRRDAGRGRGRGVRVGLRVGVGVQMMIGGVQRQMMALPAVSNGWWQEYWLNWAS